MLFRSADYYDARYSNVKTLSEEDNVHLIRDTRMTPLYAGGLEEVEPSSVPAPGLASTT